MKKVILITGVSSGFGRAMAEMLLGEGHIVYGTIRTPIDFTIDGLYLKTLDVTDNHRASEVVEEIIAEQGRIDVLINNAGIGISGAIELTTKQEADLQIGVGFFGVFNMCATLLPHFRKQRSGRIINISSIAGRFAVPYQGMYSVAKSAVEAYSEALSLETSQFDIDVVIVQPGDFNTGFTKNRIISTHTSQNPDYAASYSRVLANIEKDETSGGKPTYLAQKISKIVSSKKPKFRYVVTPSFVQRLSTYAHYILPDRWFQWILRKFYTV